MMKKKKSKQTINEKINPRNNKKIMKISSKLIKPISKLQVIL